MRKLVLLLITASLLSTLLTAQEKKIGNETPEQKKERMQWWTDARFGMFIHWGLYSEAARHEWVKSNEHMTNEQYQKYFDEFNPDLFEPSKWAKEDGRCLAEKLEIEGIILLFCKMKKNSSN